MNRWRFKVDVFCTLKFVSYSYWGEGLEFIPCALVFSRRCARRDCLYVNESKTHSTHIKLLSVVQDKRELVSLSLFLLCVWVFASTSYEWSCMGKYTHALKHSTVQHSTAKITIRTLCWRTLAALGKRTAFDDTRKCFALFYIHTQWCESTTKL